MKRIIGKEIAPNSTIKGQKPCHKSYGRLIFSNANVRKLKFPKQINVLCFESLQERAIRQVFFVLLEKSKIFR